MKLVVLVPLLPYLLEYNSPLFRALSYNVQHMVQYAKTYKCLNSCGPYGYVWHLCKTHAERGSRTFLPGHFSPRKMQITLLKLKLDWLSNICEVEAGLMKQFFVNYKLDWWKKSFCVAKTWNIDESNPKTDLIDPHIW